MKTPRTKRHSRLMLRLRSYGSYIDEVLSTRGHPCQETESINEFLPVKDLADRPIDLPVLRQFGLVDSEKVDHLLAAVFRKEDQPDHKRRSKVKKQRRKKPDVSI